MAKNMISKKVKVLDLNCSSKSVQGGVDRFDFCTVSVRTQKGKRGSYEIVDLPGIYEIGTVFIAAHPLKARAMHSGDSLRNNDAITNTPAFKNYVKAVNRLHSPKRRRKR